MATTDLGDIELYYEDVGHGTPIVWCHEYFGDYRSWGPQLNAFSREFRCIVYSARGYPGSSVPATANAYSQDLMIEDLRGLLDHLGIERAVVVGLSMGGGVAVNFGIRHQDRCLGLVIAGCGSGSSNRAAFEANAASMLEVIEQEGMSQLYRWMELDPTRVQLKVKDPFGWKEFASRLAEHSATAASLIYRNVQLRRPSILSLGSQLSNLFVPSFITFGDQDSGCVEPGLFMWRSMPDARLAVLPASGHCINLEEPELFNAIVRNFVVELSR